jgi:hypothetical protein
MQPCLNSLSSSDTLSRLKSAITLAADVTQHERMATIGGSANAAVNGGIMPGRRRFKTSQTRFSSPRRVPLLYVLRRIERVSFDPAIAARSLADHYFIVTGNRLACG